MFQITYKKVSAFFYFLVMLVTTAVLVAAMSFLLINEGISTFTIVIEMCLLLVVLMLSWTCWFLLIALFEKWAVKIDVTGIIFNKSLGSFLLEYDQIESTTTFLQMGYSQIGIKIKDRKNWRSNLTMYQKVWAFTNRVFVKQDLIIPGYMIHEDPIVITNTIDELINEVE